ncbi:MAG: hypothetical protein BWY72_01200 [Bacteroidetes bacterium ADurb.Bin416]|nr:MAG: hypothetical protein BWY72_01200 [Bacteroidetes bacterium ADurb.Bin416]
MDIFVGSGDLNLYKGQAAHTAVDGRHILVNHGRVGHKDEVTGQQLLMICRPVSQGRGTDFFLALNEKLKVAGQSTLAQQVFHGLDVEEGLPFVVVGAPAVNGALSNLGFKGRGFPQVERIGRLHIVVPVNQRCRQIGVYPFLGKHHRVALRGVYFGRICA